MKKGYSPAGPDLGSLLDTGSESIWMVDRDFNYIYFNKVFSDNYFKSLKKKCRIGMSALTHLGKEEKNFWKIKYNKGFNGKKLEFEYPFRVRKEKRFFLISLNPVVEEGTVTGVSVISSDITGHKILEQEKMIAEKRFEILTAHARVGIFFDNAKGEAIYLNDKCAELVGVPARNALNYDWVPYIHPEDRERVISSWGEAIKKKRPFREVYRWVHPDGKIVWTEGFINPVFDSEGNVEIFIGTLYDLTDQILAEKKLISGENRLRALFEESPVSLWEEDISGAIELIKRKRIKNLRKYFKNHKEFLMELAGKVRVMNVNHESVRMFEAGSKEELMDNLGKTFTGKSFEVFTEELIAFSRGETEFESEVEFNTIKGRRFDAIICVRTGLTASQENDEKSFDTIVSIVDITRKTQAENELRMRQMELKAISEFGRVISRLVGRSEMIEISLNKVLEITGASAAFLLIRDGDNLNEEKIVFSDPSYGFIEFPPHKIPECLCGASVVERRPLYSKNIHTDKRCTWDECKEAGLKSAVVFPLIKQDEVFAVLGLGSVEEHDFEEHHEFLESIASDLARGIENNILYHEIEKYSRELESKVLERTRELESFSYSVSHDLRAPLRAISGFSKILNDDFYENLPDEGRELLEDIRKNASGMGHLIDDLLEFSRLGRKSIKKKRIDMKLLFKSSYAELKDFYDPKKIDFFVEDLPDADGDFLLIRQAVLNLVSNALKFSSGRKKSIIRITGKMSDGLCSYSVSDNGVGFDMKYSGRLFGVFQRLHGKDEFEGTGVGLAIVKRIIEKHGGKVWAKSIPGKGSVFHFTLRNDLD